MAGDPVSLRAKRSEREPLLQGPSADPEDISHLAVQRIEEVAMRGLDLPLEAGLKLEREGFRELMQTEDAIEGALAFAQKRLARWSGK